MRNEAYIRYAAVTKDAAEHRSWTFYKAIKEDAKKWAQTITFLDSAIRLIYKLAQVRDMEKIKMANIQIAIIIIGVLIITSFAYGGWAMV